MVVWTELVGRCTAACGRNYWRDQAQKHASLSVVKHETCAMGIILYLLTDSVTLLQLGGPAIASGANVPDEAQGAAALLRPALGLRRGFRYDCIVGGLGVVPGHLSG